MIKYLLIVALVLCVLDNMFDLWGNSIDARFSEKTLSKLRLNEKSFIRKLIPFKEGIVKDKKGNVRDYRYCLKIRAIPYFISLIFCIISLVITILNVFLNIIPNKFFTIASLIVLMVHCLRLCIINLCSNLF